MDFSKIKLRDGQTEVAKYEGGMMAVPAVPGAGKTFTLAYLAAKLIEEKRIEDGRILIVTYMNSAVSNFRSRIENFLEAKGIEGRGSFEVKTLHSLAMTILKERPDHLMINSDFKVLDESEEWKIINRIIYKWLKENTDQWEHIIDCSKGSKWHDIAFENWSTRVFPGLVKSMIGHLKGHGMDIHKVGKLHGKVSDYSYLAWACEIFIEYSKELARNGWLDFNDLLLNSWKLLKEDKELRKRLGKRWTFIFEDEAQDSNILQEQILFLLSKEKGNLIRVGDSNQSIMGSFTLAEPEVFRSFAKREDVKKGAILSSSRSTLSIIDLANYLVTWANKEHPVKKCQDALEKQFIDPVDNNDPFPNPKIDEYGIKTRRFTTREEELEGIVEEAINYSKEHSEDTVAILVPNNYTQKEVIELLKKKGASFEEVGNISSKQEITISTLEDIIYYLATPYKKGQLLKVLDSVLLESFGGEELAGVERLLEKRSVAELIYPISGELSPLELPDEVFARAKLLSEFKGALEKLRQWLKASMKLSADELILHLAQELELQDDILALAQGMALYVKDKLRENPSWKLKEVVDEIKELEPSFISLAKKLYDAKGFEPQKGVITVLTAHKSKGLEWDGVFIISLVSDEYPSTLEDKFKGEAWYLKDDKSNPVAIAKADFDKNFRGKIVGDSIKESKIEIISERLRLLYVGITRAKKRLTLSGYDKRKNWDGSKLNDIGVSYIFHVLERYIKEKSEVI
ncbi:ATP-dependent helicase [Halonatronum saccharophilum]|uniref:ATP-dependent helicase n=1 Tax=Halonatronum saccharophilum TaxID=150060 RepID=UPI0004875268|nr:ATP-dependent helicase [Halonatronum saccharophilum]